MTTSKMDLAKFQATLMPLVAALEAACEELGLSFVMSFSVTNEGSPGFVSSAHLDPEDPGYDRLLQAAQLVVPEGELENHIVTPPSFEGGSQWN